ncbi:hypothetical protein [Malacoplasma muris]|uniref:hypothetical protein n=1 Tax=Malacoplasma muris TaxID=2119 RepID=UPI00398E4CB1
MTGINNIKVVAFGGTAKDGEIYLNNSTSKFVVSKNSMMGVTTSRKYDIEEKTVSIYKLNSSTNKVEKFSVKIPMFFIQNDNDNT